MEDIRGSIKLVLLFVVVAILIILILLLAPSTLKLTPPSGIFPQ